MLGLASEPLERVQMLLYIRAGKVRIEETNGVMEGLRLNTELLGKVAHPLDKDLSILHVEALWCVNSTVGHLLDDLGQHQVHGDVSAELLVGVSNSFDGLDDSTTLAVTHSLVHLQRCQVLEVSTGFAVAEVTVLEVDQEVVTVHLAAGLTFKIDLKCRHFLVTCRVYVHKLFLSCSFWSGRAMLHRGG